MYVYENHPTTKKYDLELLKTNYVTGFLSGRQAMHRLTES